MGYELYDLTEEEIGIVEAGQLTKFHTPHLIITLYITLIVILYGYGTISSWIVMFSCF